MEQVFSGQTIKIAIDSEQQRDRAVGIDTPDCLNKLKTEEIESGHDSALSLRIDTLDCLNKLKTEEIESGHDRVRLIGIDAPDWRQKPWGSDAKTRLQNLLEGQSVWIEFDEKTKDDYNRHLVYVWLDEGLLVNELLVREGYVLAAERQPNTKYSQRLARAQEWARLRELGIWNPKNPMRLTPTEFRRENRQ